MTGECGAGCPRRAFFARLGLSIVLPRQARLVWGTLLLGNRLGQEKLPRLLSERYPASYFAAGRRSLAPGNLERKRKRGHSEDAIASFKLALNRFLGSSPGFIGSVTAVKLALSLDSSFRFDEPKALRAQFRRYCSSCLGSNFLSADAERVLQAR